MVGWYLSEQARQAMRDARGLAHERQHTALGPPHLLAAILQQWDDQHAAGPALRFVLAHAHRIAAQARAPYVGTEHLVVAMLWLDYGGGLRRQSISYQRAAEQLLTLPYSVQAVEDAAIEPLEAVGVPTPAVAGLAELARQQAEQHPVEGDGRVSTLHYLLALLMDGGAGRLLGELGVSYNAARERLAADGARLVEADDRRPEERPLQGWERFDITSQQWEAINPRVKEVIVDQGLWQQGVRFGFNLNEDKTRYWVIIHPGESGFTHQEVLDRLLGRAS